MTFRGVPSGFSPTGVVFEARDFDQFASTIGQANRLLQGLNRNINSAVNDFNSLGRSGSGLGRNFAPLGNVSQNFRAFRTEIRQTAQDFFFLQFAARQAVQAIEAVGTALLAPIGTAIDFEDQFAGVAKTIDGLTDPDAIGDGFVKLTGLGQDLKDALTELSTEIPVTFEELSSLAQLGGQFGLVTPIQRQIADARDALDLARESGNVAEITFARENLDRLNQQLIDIVIDFTKTAGGLGEATDIASEQAGQFLARITAIFGTQLPEGFDVSDNLRALGTTLTALGNNFNATESQIAQLTVRLAGASAAANLGQDDMLGLAAATASVGVQPEAAGTALSRLLLDIQSFASVGENALRDNSTAISATNEELSKLYADLVQLEAVTGRSGAEFFESLKDLEGEELGRLLGDKNLERLFRTQQAIVDYEASLASLIATDKTAPTDGQLGAYLRVTGFSIDEFTKAAEEPEKVLLALVEGLARVKEEGGDLDATFTDLGINNVRSERVLLSLANAGDLLRRALGLSQEEFATINTAAEENNALNTELANRYATVASEIEKFKNAVIAARNELGAPFLTTINKALEAANQFVGVFTERIPFAIRAIQDTFAPLGEAISDALGGFTLSPQNFRTFLDGVIASIARFDITPIVTGFNFFVDNFGIISELVISAATGLAILTGGVIALNLALVAGPLLAYTAAVSGLVFVWRNFDEIAARAQQIYTQLELPEALGPSITNIKDAFSKLGESLTQLGENLGIGDFVTRLTDAAPDLITFGANLATAFTQTLLDRIASLIGIFDGIVVAIDGLATSNFDTFIDGIRQVGDSALEGILAPFENVGESLNFDFTPLADQIRTAFDTAFDEIPNPILRWLSGTDDTPEIGTGLLAQQVNTDLISGLNDSRNELERAIQEFTKVFDDVVAVPTGEDQNPAQVFVDRFLEPFRTIDLPEIDLSPISEAFANLVSPETLTAFAEGFSGVSDSLSALGDTFEGDVFGRFAEGLGRIAAFQLERTVNEINELATGVGLLGNFAATYAENIGQFFGTLIEIPLQQLEGAVEIITGLGSIAGADSLKDVADSIETIGQGLLTIATAPLQVFEIFTGQEIAAPTLDFSGWGIQVLEIIEEIQRIFTEDVTINLPPLTIGDLAVEALKSILSNVFANIEFTAPDLSNLLLPFQVLAAQIRALFLPANLFGGLLELQVPSIVPGIGGQTGAELLGLDTSAIDESLDSVADRITAARIELQEAGRNIPQGVEAGIEEEAATLLETAARVLFTSPADIVRALWETQSPSQVTQRLGQDIIAGLALGLADTESIFTALSELTTTILEQFNLLGTQLNTLIAPALLLTNEQFTLTNNNLLLLNENTAAYTPVLQELTAAFNEVGSTVQNAVIPPLTALDLLFQSARGNARRLGRAVNQLAKEYKTLASALQDARRAGSATAAIPQTAAVNPPAFQEGGSMLVPSAIPSNLRGPTGGMIIEVHAGELVQIFNKAMTRQISSLPRDSIIGRPDVREPSFSGAGISNQVNNTFNTTNNSGSTDYHLHINNAPSSNIVDSFDLLRTLSRTRA